MVFALLYYPGRENLSELKMAKSNAGQPSVIHADFEKQDVLEGDLALGASPGMLVNCAENLKFVGESIDAIGFGKFQWQLTLTCAFGFIADQVCY